MNFKKDKRGVIGPFMVTFIATISIVLILIIFTLGAGAVKVVSRSDGGLMVHSERDIGIGSARDYIVFFVRAVRLRSLFEAEGVGFVEAVNRAEKLEVKKIVSGERAIRFKYTGAKRDEE